MPLLLLSDLFFSKERHSPNTAEHKEQKKREKQRLEREKKEQKEREKKENEMKKKFKVSQAIKLSKGFLPSSEAAFSVLSIFKHYILHVNKNLCQ